jgi:hypothetical protein
MNHSLDAPDRRFEIELDRAPAPRSGGSRLLERHAQVVLVHHVLHCLALDSEQGGGVSEIATDASQSLFEHRAPHDVLRVVDRHAD